MALKIGDSLRFVPDASKVHFLCEEEQARLHSVLFEMTKDVVQFCEERSLTIMLGGGSCLGAVRHRGFIPWDDDIDLNIPREDFEVLYQEFNTCFQGRYVLLVPGRTPGYMWRIPQVRKIGTHVLDYSALGEEYDGAFLDLFIIENVPRNLAVRYLQGIASLFFQYLLSCRRYWSRRQEYAKLKGVVSPEAMRAIRMKQWVGMLTALCPFERIARAGDRVNAACRNKISSFMTIPTGRKFYFGEMVNRDTLLPVSNGQFCEAKFPLPRCPDSYLRGLYDNYNQVPSEEQQEHHFFLKFELPERSADHDDQAQGC